MENPFIEPIFELLLRATKPLKIHDISHALKPLHQTQLDEDPNCHLFKLNFLLMNGLYQLQDELSKDYVLQISTLHITLTARENNASQQVTRGAADNLKNYYLDWRNYQTSPEEVAALLNSFWQQVHSPTPQQSELSQAEALALFNLNENATFAEIKQRWRKLALVYHPDRGSHSPEKFKQYHAAWQALKDIHVCIS